MKNYDFEKLEQLLNEQIITDLDYESVLKNKIKVSQPMAIEFKIDFISFCSHDILPFFGTAYIKINITSHTYGLSNIEEMIKMMCSKLTLQEDLTIEIATVINNLFETKNTNVKLTSTHLCKSIRTKDMNKVITEVTI